MSEKEITVYTSDDCEESIQIIDYLKELQVNYNERNVSENRAYLTELQARNVYSVPAVFINNQVVLGFQKDKIYRLVRLS
ncbi:MAG TPA: glutaredoxin family protein [Bacilli bacterium]|uniref:Glutaredoxin domain-containing protein n=1 Tax=Amphibacillus indicireducens TaxID=1076330 RepID=A0ABP7VUU4_9BACI|nr:glutaredoxin family protein [Bacilli bacterium]